MRYLKWSETLGQINVKDFSGPALGPTTVMDKSKYVIDYYKEIARQTNAYAERSMTQAQTLLKNNNEKT